MQRHGFIHDELERKTLILYVLAKVGCAVTLENLTEMAMCDNGMDYFEYSTCLANLVETEHILAESDGVITLYRISPKGIQNLIICEAQLPASVRGYADKRVAKVKEDIARSKFVTAELSSSEDGKLSVVCRLMDDADEILSMRIGVSSRSQGEALAKNFRRRAEEIFNSLLTELSTESDD